VRDEAHFHGTFHQQLSRLQRGRTPLQGVTAMDDYISPSDDYGLADGASSQALKWASRCSRCSAPKHVICLHWLWKKMCPHVRLFINYVLCQECNNYLQVCQERNNHALCQEFNNYQQLKLSAKNARSTSNSSASASNTSVSSTKGSVLASTPASFLDNGQQKVKCVVENSTFVHGRNNTY